MVYYAKSPDSNGHRETCAEHIRKVAVLAAQFGRTCGLEEEAQLCGFLHDFGKYSEAFQGVLLRTHQGIDHALAGAAFLNYKKGKNYVPFRNAIDKKGKNYVPFGNAIEVIAAHHDGLYSYDEIKAQTEKSLREEKAIITRANKTAALAGEAQYGAAYQAFKTDFPDFRTKITATAVQDDYGYMLKSRMLLSCLVDADYSASGGITDYPVRTLDTERILSGLYRKIEEKQTDSALNRMRREVFRICGEAGLSHERMFTLTAPTGIGKTYALLHFALRHMAENKKSRIIVVLPFLSISDQTEKVYGELIPDILVDNSGKEPKEDYQMYAERWDAPFIITTSVKFFELLFRSKPTELRKLHSIADSIVIFDEAQTLPAELVKATLFTLRALCDGYGTSIVFSTATQPDYAADDEISGIWHPTEILENYREYYDRLRRVRVGWELDTPMGWETLAARMAESENVCAIVNLRRHALSLFTELQKQFGEDDNSLFLISTDLCPAHRKNIIEEIKMRQKTGLPCHVVSTQCIEAGVDLDFAVLFRALAPLEAIIQAAGRCNRNGHIEDGGAVTVFVPAPEEEGYPDSWYKRCAGMVKILQKTEGIDLCSAEDIRRYYRSLGLHTNEKLKKAIGICDYPTAAEEYRLIENDGIKIIVPYEAEGKLFEEIQKEAEGGMTKELMRLSAPITVSCYPPKDMDIERYAEPIRFPRKKAESDYSGYYILRPQVCRYSDKTGLQFVVETDENTEYII